MTMKEKINEALKMSAGKMPMSVAAYSKKEVAEGQKLLKGRKGAALIDFVLVVDENGNELQPVAI